MDPGEHTMVDGTSLRRIRAAVPALPDELVQWDILLRLPAKELLRCRAVCRTWCRLASDAAFLLAHHRRQPSLPLVFFRTTDHPYTNDASVDALDVRRTPAVRRPVLGFDDYNKSRRKFTLHASCDGLLLLSLSNHRFYLCNPATRQWCVLPGLTGGNVTALYPHRPSGKYRVLSWKHPNNDRYSVDYYVLALGSCSSQSQGPKARCIGLPVASPSMKKKNSPDRWLIHACEHPPVLLRDCLHWYAGDVLDSKIVVFDTVAESFRWMQTPKATSSAAHLLQMDGAHAWHWACGLFYKVRTSVGAAGL
ncbi:F-box protein At5g49610-like [Triticum aestivum]|uniref:F-box protein At5g49610-like n=1 Tax=Triticum aestivum TaxID=4565 RepID=UPI001D004C50|nr:F-box protein At5g49610-like [Triticum aestivum]